MEEETRRLYQALLEAWNHRSADQMAALFLEEGYTVGFDGSVHDGPGQIRAEIGAIFAHHPTAAFLAIVRRVAFPLPDTAVLRAEVGMVPPGASDINPATNAVQTLVAVRRGAWRIAVFHNTPAAFHGRPEAGEALSAELRAVLKSGAVVT
jgi:uncharacterized protein (TIGR02246 family)